MTTIEGAGFTGKPAIDTAIRIALIAIMAGVTVRIIHPFLMPVPGGIIIAVAVNPFFNIAAKKLGDRRKLTAILFALVVIAALVIPSVMLLTTSIDTVQEMSDRLDSGTIAIPPPPAKVAEWPMVGESVYKFWSQAHSNLEAVIMKFGPQIKDFAMLLLSTAGGGLKGVIMFVISVVIASALLASAEKFSLTTTRVISRAAGSMGPELQALATAAIRGVMLGVVGVAVIQSVLAAIGMVLIGVPAAGFWAVLVLIFAVIQIPPLLVLGPVAAWVFTFADTVPAVIFLVWAIAVGAGDSFLKPVLMGRGVDAPMLVILIGALGGMMMSGIIGLFVGAVVVAISYTLFMVWVDEEPSAESSDNTSIETNQ